LLVTLLSTSLLLLLQGKAWAPDFQNDPAVRVVPNTSVQFKWVYDVAWLGKVEVFDNADGTGTPRLVREDIDQAGNPVISMDHEILVDVVAPLAVDTGYFFRVTMTDSTKSLPPQMTPPPLPPFFTGVQAIRNLTVEPGFDRVLISWSANVIGFGRVTRDQAGPIQDASNATDHAIELTGLSPGTTYGFEVSNVHALDAGVLASMPGSFTTRANVKDARLLQPRAKPHAIDSGATSVLSVMAVQQSAPLPGIPVTFEVLPDSPGSATIDGGPSATVQTDATGRAAAVLTGISAGLVRVKASSPAFADSIGIAVAVR
jgi:hypothetical protein